MKRVSRYFYIVSFLSLTFFLGMNLRECQAVMSPCFGVGSDEEIFNNETISITRNGEIYSETDCEHTLLYTVPGTPDLTSILNINDEVLLIIGYNGTIVRTTKSDHNFYLINSPTTQDLFSFDEQNGTIVAVGYSKAIIRSTDTGLTWELVNPPSGSYKEVQKSNITSFGDTSNINFTDVYIDPYLSSFVQVVGDNLSLFQTFNGGVTWSQIPLTIGKFGKFKDAAALPTINRLYHFDGLNAYIVADSGIIIRTTDNFTSYEYINANTLENINDIYFISADSGFIVGDNGTIRFTTDGGTDWLEDPEVDDLFDGKDIKKIAAFNNNFGSIIADSGLSFIVARDSSYFTTSVESEQEMPSEYSLSQNYPNPFNPTTKINYSVPEYGMVTIKVYDMLGKEVATLVNEEKNAGNYQAIFNSHSGEGRNLTSGVYFYKLTSKNFTETKKLVLMK